MYKDFDDFCGAVLSCCHYLYHIRGDMGPYKQNNLGHSWFYCAKCPHFQHRHNTGTVAQLRKLSIIIHTHININFKKMFHILLFMSMCCFTGSHVDIIHIHQNLPLNRQKYNTWIVHGRLTQIKFVSKKPSFLTLITGELIPLWNYASVLENPSPV